MKSVISWNGNYCSKIDCQDSNSEVTNNTCEMTELHLIAFRNDIKVAEYLLAENVNVNCKNKCGLTPLLIAVQKGNIEVVELLLSKGANINSPDINGYSPLQAAFDSDDQELVDLLLAYSTRC